MKGGGAWKNVTVTWENKSPPPLCKHQTSYCQEGIDNYLSLTSRACYPGPYQFKSNFVFPYYGKRTPFRLSDAQTQKQTTMANIWNWSYRTKELH